MKILWSLFFLLLALASMGQPRFDAQVLDSQVEIGYGLAIGDVDGDKKPDILLADKKQFVWYRNGDWKRFVLVENLTGSDNVCIAARDIDGDGRVEIAVGAQWNPGETSDTTKSGSVHYLIRPTDPTTLWLPVELHHEPTVHRMRWIQVAGGRFQLIVLPLHGRGNKDGKGKGVKVFAYEKPRDPRQPWKLQLIDSTMHLTHNMDIVPDGNRERVFIGGKEGVKVFDFGSGRWAPSTKNPWPIQGDSFGEVRIAIGKKDESFVAGIQPMHGTMLAVYDASMKKKIIAEGFGQGHALAIGSITTPATIQLVAGWREPDTNGQVGIKLFVADNTTYREWTAHWIDQNGMACEDLQVADVNGDGKKDIIAAGRSTHNLKIYWNRN
ncbi:MAG TPA: FG-GAP-like repeat-containing protein [Chryseolinea sp.]|nr:FG-GAP-like repeat-containing protein [Chryseolinea sp.]